MGINRKLQKGISKLPIVKDCVLSMSTKERNPGKVKKSTPKQTWPISGSRVKELSCGSSSKGYYLSVKPWKKQWYSWFYSSMRQCCLHILWCCNYISEMTMRYFHQEIFCLHSINCELLLTVLKREKELFCVFSCNSTKNQRLPSWINTTLKPWINQKKTTEIWI